MKTDITHFSSTRKTITFGFVIIALIFGVLGGWAAVAPLSQGAVASGKVVVENQRKSVQHLEGGIVKDIMVKEGDSVEAGDTLIVLDDKRSKANAHALTKQFYLSRAEEARLISEIKKQDKIHFFSDLTEAPEHYLIQQIMYNQQALFNARKQALAGEFEILGKKEVQLKRLAEGLRAQKKSKALQIELLNEEIKDNQKLFKTKAISKVRLLELKRMEADMEGEYGSLISEIASTELQTSETRLKMLQLEKSFQEKILLEMREVQKRLVETQEKMLAAKDILQRSVIMAPVSGIVVNNQIYTRGEIVNSGETLLEIVPQNIKLVVEAEVQTQDIDTIAPGMEAEVRFLPFKQRLIPIVIGKVTAVSADILENERTGESYYLAKVEIPPSEMEKLGKHTLVPGMPADVIVNAGQYTMLEYLLAPLTDNFARAFKE